MDVSDSKQKEIKDEEPLATDKITEGQEYEQKAQQEINMKKKEGSLQIKAMESEKLEDKGQQSKEQKEALKSEGICQETKEQTDPLKIFEEAELNIDYERMKQAGYTEKDFEDLTKFSKILTHHISTTEFILSNPRIDILQFMEKSWMEKKNFDSEKKLEIRLIDLSEPKKKFIIHHFKRNPTIILSIDDSVYKSEGIVKRDDSVYYMGTKEHMTINNLQTFNFYEGPVRELNDLTPHGFGFQKINLGKIKNQYKGNFKNGNREGLGQQTTKGYEYEGQWENNQRHGYGRQTIFSKRKNKTKTENNSNQSISSLQKIEQAEEKPQNLQAKNQQAFQVSEEMFYPFEENYIAESQKSLNQADLSKLPAKLPPGVKSIFYGQFQYNKKSGEGQQLTRSSRYKGFWDNNERNGEGQIWYKNGAYYKGQWVDNLISGIGVYTDQFGNVYDGEFQNGYRHGTGTMDYKNGDKYEGSWQNGIWHGQGVYTWAAEEDQEQDYYDGQWARGSAEGEGTSMMNGIFYTGSFYKGMKHGMGEEADEQGNVTRGIWKNNEMVEKITDEDEQPF